LKNYWGVDPAAKVTKELYDCVLKNFGKPLYWGRYLTTVPNKADGLSRDEIQLLKNSGTKVLPIYTNFTKATSERDGRTIARNMIFSGKRLGIPKEKILFANIERFFEVDAAWIKGYVDVMYNSDYKSGIYFDPITPTFNKAYCEAVAIDSKIATHLVLWSARPETGVSKARNAPRFSPSKPPCKANVWGWQYGRDAEECPIDTNLITAKLFEMLW
jgi:hypothetical protein